MIYTPSLTVGLLPCVICGCFYGCAGLSATVAGPPP